MTDIERSDASPLKKLASRRTVIRAGAWTAPVVATVVAAPAAMASVGDTTDVGAFSANGSCGTLGLIGPGFTLTAGTGGIPVGTTVAITGSGVANIGVFSITGGTAKVDVLSGTSRLITFTSAVPAGATVSARTTLSISVAFNLDAVVTLPTGYTGSGSKPTAHISSTLILCSAS